MTKIAVCAFPSVRCDPTGGDAPIWFTVMMSPYGEKVYVRMSETEARRLAEDLLEVLSGR